MITRKPLKRWILGSRPRMTAEMFSHCVEGRIRRKLVSQGTPTPDSSLNK